jgi:DNA-binding transcriptional ArsR family regulator
MARPQSPDAAIAKVLSHPTRPRILEILTRRGEASPNELAGELGQTVGAVSYHIRLLRDRGWVELVRTEPRRGAVEHFYRATQRPKLEDAQWERLPVAVRRRLAGHTLGEVLRAATRAADVGGFDAAESHIARVSLELDAEGRSELSSALARLLDEVAGIQRRSNARGAATARSRSQLAVLHHAVDDGPRA